MKIEVVTKISTVYVVSDTGYTSNMTLPEIEKWAKDHIRSVQLLIKEGGTEPKVVPAQFDIEQIRFTPDKDSGS